MTPDTVVVSSSSSRVVGVSTAVVGLEEGLHQKSRNYPTSPKSELQLNYTAKQQPS